jgi:two-component system sporulation sensor kinase C
MSASYVTDFASAVEASGSEGSRHGRAEVGVSIREPMISRVIEGSLSQLDLVTVPIAEDLLDLESHGGSVWETKLESLVGFEMIVADEPEARRIVGLFERRRESGEGVYPAVIAVVTRGEDGTLAGSDDVARDAGDSKYDAVLWLPKPPAAVAAQMSLVLYAHRRFARRYQTAMDELNLNRRIFRSVTSGISIADATKPDLPLTYVNPAFEVMTGYSLEEVLGKNCRFLQGDALDQPAITLVREAIRDKRETLVILKNYRKDGTPFWNELSLSPIRNRHGMLTHFVGIQTDVTARVEFEDALRESEKLAAVGRLASSIAHEINNPLESVMNLIYLAQMPGSDAQSVKTYLSMADKELQRVKVITSQSLRFYKQSTKPQVTGTKELLNSVVDVYQARLQNGHVDRVHGKRDSAGAEQPGGERDRRDEGRGEEVAGAQPRSHGLEDWSAWGPDDDCGYGRGDERGDEEGHLQGVLYDQGDWRDRAGAVDQQRDCEPAQRAADGAKPPGRAEWDGVCAVSAAPGEGAGGKLGAW